MNNCSHLYLLSALACQLSETMTDDDIAVLSSNLVILSDMLAGILTRKSLDRD